MVLPLHKGVLKAAYDYLAELPPFSKWNLPDSDDVSFRVTRSKKIFGSCAHCDNGSYEIVISEATIGQHLTLLATMAHEMVHIHQAMTLGQNLHVAPHGKAFKKLAAQVCKVHGFDPKNF